jgi:hypothetical protein
MSKKAKILHKRKHEVEGLIIIIKELRRQVKEKEILIRADLDDILKACEKVKPLIKEVEKLIKANQETM